METDGSKFRDLVKARLDELGTNAFAVEQQHGLPADMVRNVIRERIPRLDSARRIADALGLEFYIGPHRTDPSADTASGKEGSGYCRIRLHSTLFSAGPGALNMEPDPEDGFAFVAFDELYLKERHLKSDDLICARVRGNSMAPNIVDDMMIMIETTDKSLAPREPYALILPDGEAVIKRPQVAGDQLLLKSDNPDVDIVILPRVDAARVQIVGRVVWYGFDVAGLPRTTSAEREVLDDWKMKIGWKQEAQG